jgi:uncharacterized damage-inducible protein DinB
MQNEVLQRMIDYHYWAQNKVWECILPLTDEQMPHDPGYSRGSVHAQWMHMYIVEWTWYRIVIHDVPKVRAGWPNPDDLQTRDQIRTAWDALEPQVRHFVQTATEEELNRMVMQPLIDPPPWSMAWEAVIYIVTHAADHRSQILQLIHALGGKTVMQDFIQYVWQTGDQM